jgi:hypothetical protein
MTVDSSIYELLRRRSSPVRDEDSRNDARSVVVALLRERLER